MKFKLNDKVKILNNTCDIGGCSEFPNRTCIGLKGAIGWEDYTGTPKEIRVRFRDNGYCTAFTEDCLELMNDDWDSKEN